jgi:hypothetical protein
MRRDDVYLALEHVESWTGKARSVVGDLLFTGQVKRFRVGDVLFGKLRPYLAKVALATSQGVCAGEFFVLRSRDSNIISRRAHPKKHDVFVLDFMNTTEAIEEAFADYYRTTIGQHHAQAATRATTRPARSPTPRLQPPAHAWYLFTVTGSYEKRAGEPGETCGHPFVVGANPIAPMLGRPRGALHR